MNDHVKTAHKKKKRKQSEEVNCIFPGCGEIFTRKPNMMSHYNQVHMGLIPKFFCGFDDCKEEFTAKPILKRHETKMHTGQRIKCKETGCVTEFQNSEEMNDHMRAIHKVNNKAFHCDLFACTFRSDIADELEKHKEAVHMPQKCDFKDCDHVFTKISSLVKHKTGHTGKNPIRAEFDECGLSIQDHGKIKGAQGRSYRPKTI